MTRQNSDRLRIPSFKHGVVYDAVRLIPRGKVATYGQVALVAGLPGHARLVGYALANIDEMFGDIPWQRVVNAKGEISYSLSRAGGDDLQKILLEKEGVVFSADGRIDLMIYRWEMDQVLPEQP